MECYRIKNEKEKPEMLQLQKRVFSDFFSQAKQENCLENKSEQHYTINDAFSEALYRENSF